MSMLYKCYTSFSLSKSGKGYFKTLFLPKKKFGCSGRWPIRADPIAADCDLENTERCSFSRHGRHLLTAEACARTGPHKYIHNIILGQKVVAPLTSPPPPSKTGKRPGQRHIPASACKSGETTGSRRRAPPTGFPFSSETRTLDSLTEHRHLAADGSNIRGWVAVPLVATPE